MLCIINNSVWGVGGCLIKILCLNNAWRVKIKSIMRGYKFAIFVKYYYHYNNQIRKILSWSKDNKYLMILLFFIAYFHLQQLFLINIKWSLPLVNVAANNIWANRKLTEPVLLWSRFPSPGVSWLWTSAKEGLVFHCFSLLKNVGI